MKAVLRLTLLVISLSGFAACARSQIGVPLTPAVPPLPTTAPLISTPVPSPTGTRSAEPSPTAVASDQSALLQSKIKHIIIIMQENRSLQRFPLGTIAIAHCLPALADHR